MGLVGGNAGRRLGARVAAMSAASSAGLGERTGRIKQRGHHHHSGKSRFSFLHEAFLPALAQPLRRTGAFANPTKRQESWFHEQRITSQRSAYVQISLGP